MVIGRVESSLFPWRQAILIITHAHKWNKRQNDWNIKKYRSTCANSDLLLFEIELGSDIAFIRLYSGDNDISVIRAASASSAM